MTRWMVLLPVGLFLCSTACVELDFLLGGDGLPPNGTPNDGNGDGLPDGNDNTGASFEVALSVSNPTPQVNEEVFLTCNVVSGDAEGVVFDFQPASGRLVIDAALGIASFIVLETDVGQVFMFTCAAENALGEIATSASLAVSPNL